MKNKVIYFLKLIASTIYTINIVLNLKYLKHVIDKIYTLGIISRINCTSNDILFRKPLTLCGAKYINIAANVSFGKNAVLTALDNYQGIKYSHPQIIIGENCCFGEYNHITSINKIEIGSGLLTGRWVTITDNSHGRTDYESLIIQPQKRILYSKGPVIIGKNVWIGDKATILPNVTIGDGAVIAANSVVTKDVPPYTVVAGVPAMVVNKNKYQ